MQQPLMTAKENKREIHGMCVWADILQLYPVKKLSEKFKKL